MDVFLVKSRSKFKPNPNRDKHLEDYIHCLKNAAHTNKSNVPIKTIFAVKNVKPFKIL